MRKTFQCDSRSEAYSDDNGKTWYWFSNNAPCPLHACKDYGIPCDPAAQKVAVDKHTEAFLAEYRKNMSNRTPSNEEMFEMRAAFGPGKIVTDVITGQTFRT